MPSAWNISVGSNCIIIAIIDSGTDWKHNDLGIGSDNYQNVYINHGEDSWTNPNDPNTGNHLDDDGNGLADDWKGWNFSNNSNDSRGTFYHGTHVAGIVSAKTNNTIGIAGIAGGSNSQGVKLLPICIGLNNPDASVIDDAIIYAVNKGVKIIQLSLAVNQTNAIDAAIQFAINNGVTVIAASGNSNTSVAYPANNSNVISVGATDQNDYKAPFSNYGSNLTIAAPGVGIYSTQLNNTYNSSDGTSFASPIVSGVVALMLSINPSMTPAQIKDALITTADKVGGYNYINGRSNELGYGRLNAYAAVNSAKNINTNISGPDQFCATATYTIPNLSLGQNVTWSIAPSNISLIAVSNNQVTVTPSQGTGLATLTATINSDCGTKQVQKLIIVGIPDHLLNVLEYQGILQESVFYSNWSYSFETKAIDPNGLSLYYLYDFASTASYIWRIIYKGAYGNDTIYNLGTYGSQDNASFYFDLIGTYDIVLDIINNNCSQSRSFTRTITVQDTFGYIVSPNPSSNNITIQPLSSSTNKTTAKPVEIQEVELVNKMGVVSYRQKFNKGSTTAILSVNALPNDLYVLRIFDGKIWHSHKVLVQH